MATVYVGLGSPTAQPEQIHVGDNVLICKVSLSVSWSSGDIHVIGKLPNFAIPFDAVFYPAPASGGTFVAKFGTSASQDMFIASGSFSTAPASTRTSRRLGYGMQISLSDDARVLYENITMVATAGCSTGYVGDFVVHYKMPGQTP